MDLIMRNSFEIALEKSVKTYGPRRILVDNEFTAIGVGYPQYAPIWEQLSARGVILVRGDGWTLGARPNEYDSAFKTWKDEWIAYIPLPGVWMDISRWPEGVIR